jgi:hypothetical protein
MLSAVGSWLLVQKGKIAEDALSVATAQVLQGLSYLHRYKHMVNACPLHPKGLNPTSAFPTP